jgi:branched-chain amino acid aminotransferase
VTRVLPMVWINGKRHPADARHVSARDRGLTLADGVFETMRARGGTIFRMDRHLARIHHAMSVLAIPSPPDLRDWVLAAVQASGTEAAAVRLTVTRGDGPGGLAPPTDVHPTVIVAVNPMPVFPPEVYAKGLMAHVASGRRNERAMTAGLKTLAYTDAIVAFGEAQRAGADEALFLDTEGHCSEATASNLFVWTGSVLRTPPLSCAALPGITRATVLDIARDLAIETLEQPFGYDDLAGGHEAFLTSSLRGIAPLVRIGRTPLGDGSPGAVTGRIAAAYAALVSQECDETSDRSAVSGSHPAAAESQDRVGVREGHSAARA